MLLRGAPSAAVCDGLSRRFGRQWPDVDAPCLPWDPVPHPSTASCPEQPINTCSHPGATPLGARAGHHPPWTLLTAVVSKDAGISPPPPTPVLGSQRGSFRGLLRGRAGGPCVLGPRWPPLAPHHPLHPHSFPWQGAHRPPAGTTALAPSVSKFPLMLPDSASPRWNAKCVPERRSPSSRLGLVTPISTSHYLFMHLPPHQPDACGDCVLLGTLVHRTVLRGHEPRVSAGGLEGPHRGETALWELAAGTAQRSQLSLPLQSAELCPQEDALSPAICALIRLSYSKLALVYLSVKQGDAPRSFHKYWLSICYRPGADGGTVRHA